MTDPLANIKPIPQLFEPKLQYLMNLIDHVPDNSQGDLLIEKMIEDITTIVPFIPFSSDTTIYFSGKYFTTTDNTSNKPPKEDD